MHIVSSIIFLLLVNFNIKLYSSDLEPIISTHVVSFQCSNKILAQQPRPSLSLTWMETHGKQAAPNKLPLTTCKRIC